MLVLSEITEISTYKARILQDPLRIAAILRAAPLTTRRKSLFSPTCLAYFCRTNQDQLIITEC